MIARDYIAYDRLVATGRDVQKRGPYLIIALAGRAPADGRWVRLRYPTGKAAKRAQTALRRDLRAARSDADYNRVVSALLAEIRDGVEQAGPATPAQAEIPHQHSTGLQHVHACQPALSQPPIPCYFDWSAHVHTVHCPCSPDLDTANIHIDGITFVVHKGEGWPSPA